MDDDPSDFASIPSFTSLHKTTDLDIYVAPTAGKDKNVVRLALIPIACWRCNEQNFAFDSSFIDPGFSLGKLPDMVKSLPDSLATLFGHADPVGNDDYNKILSGRRVKATYALLTRKHKLWHDLYEDAGGTADVWGDRSTQAALSVVTDAAGTPYYAGPIDGKSSDDYKSALHRFQGDNKLAMASTAKHATREVLYPAYMKQLCGDFEMKPESFLGKGADPAGKMDYQGCSEFNPVVLLPKTEENTASDERNADNAPNRRVVMFLFRGNEDVKAADWPCPTAAQGTGKCRGQFWPGGVGEKRRKIGDERRDYALTGDTMACRFYDRFARRSPCEGRPVAVHPPNTISITTDAPQFAPITEKLVVSYTITGEMSQVWAVHLIVATKAAPDKVLLDQLVDSPYSASGTYEWDGHVTDASYDTCVSLKSSPYVLKMVLETKGGAQKTESNVVEAAVVLKDFDIRVEDPDGKQTPDTFQPALTKLQQELKSGGGVGRIVLDTPVFIRSYGAIEDGTSFQDYKAAIGDGLVVPLLARVWLKGKDGSKKRSPHALTGVHVLWDMWLDDDSSYDAALKARGLDPSAAPHGNAFVKKVSAYKQADTKPPGRTAHVKLGGSRSDAPAYFADLGLFLQIPASKRTWGALSGCGDHGAVDADAGAAFKPGRMATDSYHVRAFVDLDGSLDTTDDKVLDAVPSERRATSLQMTVWRRIEMQTVYKLGPGTPDMALAPITAEYKKAGMVVEPGSLFTNADLSTTYKSLYKTAIADLGAADQFIALAARPDPDDYPARFVSYGDFKSNAKKLTPPPGPLVVPQDSTAYAKKCDDAATSIVEYVASKLGPFPATGVTVFAWKPGAIQDRDSHVGGFASVSPYGTYGGGKNTAFFIFRTDVGGYAHELGHCLFLAHQPGSTDKDHPPAGSVADAHDENQSCVMSYMDDATHLCGGCILKLAGWDTCGSDPNKPNIDRKGNVNVT